MSIALCLFVTSCEPKTELSVSQSSLSFDNKGGGTSYDGCEPAVVAVEGGLARGLPARGGQRLGRAGGDGD